jgi:hypothetical protein
MPNFLINVQQPQYKHIFLKFITGGQYNIIGMGSHCTGIFFGSYRFFYSSRLSDCRRGSGMLALHFVAYSKPYLINKLTVMKPLTIVPVLLFMLVAADSFAQPHLPKGYQKGTIQLLDNSTKEVYVKPALQKDATLPVLQPDNGNKRIYKATELLALTMDSAKYLSINGDFYKVLTAGELYFVQKSSNASAQPVYNGTELVAINTSLGNVNDYFIYDPAKKDLIRVTKNNFKEILQGTFSNFSPGMALAKEGVNNPGLLIQAVEWYNKRNK